MLLQKLVEYYSRHSQSPPPMYQSTPIKWIIEIDHQGKMIGQGPVPTTQSGRKSDRGKEFVAPHVLRTSGIRAKLLADTASYVLGLKKEKEKNYDQAQQRFQAFSELTRECAQTTGEKAVLAVQRFLENFPGQERSWPPELRAEDNVTFRVHLEQGPVLPFELERVKEFWAQKQEASAGGGKNPQQCMVCGRSRPPVDRHPIKIKGVPGGQTSGMAMVSANASAFESYGLRASLIAPMCMECCQSYARAVNKLIRDSSTHLRVGPMVYLFWTREEPSFSVSQILSDPDPAQVKELMQSAFASRAAATALDYSPFYATAFSSSGSRIAVREWLKTTVGKVRSNLAGFFRLQRLVDEFGKEGSPLGIYRLARSLVRENIDKELPPNAVRCLLNTALKGDPLPPWMLYQAVKRARVERRLTYPRAALVKMVLLSTNRSRHKEDDMVQLNTRSQDPAYLCGRLLSVLESIQQSAVPGINTTIVDRFYGTASTAPASVFGVLLKGAQAHLSKLRKQKGAVHGALQRRVEEILAGLEGNFPHTLSLQEQGLFALGYYHQRAQDRADRAAAAGRKAEA